MKTINNFRCETIFLQNFETMPSLSVSLPPVFTQVLVILLSFLRKEVVNQFSLVGILFEIVFELQMSFNGFM